MALSALGIFSAAGAGVAPSGAGAYELIQSSILTSDTAIVTFSSIPQDFKHLELRFIARTTQATTNASANIRLNADSGSNYRNHILEGTGSEVRSENFGPNTAIFSQILGTSVANAWPAAVWQILDYTSTSNNKTLRGLNGWASTDPTRIRLLSGLYINTATVSTVGISVSTGNFLTGSRFSLYGIKG